MALLGRKGILVPAAAMLAVASSCGCPDPVSTGSPATATAGAGGTAAAGPAPVPFTLLGLNDFHGAINGKTLAPSGLEVGGAEWLSGYINAIRGSAPGHTLLFDAGDIFQGTRISNNSEGRCTLEVYNRLGFEAATVGNHEFDYGPVGAKSVASEPGEDPVGALRALAAAAAFPFVMSNVFVAETGKRPEWTNVVPTHMVERGGLRIGILGFTTISTPTTTMPPNVAGLKFRRAEEVARELIPKLEARGADFIVALGHLGGRCAGTGCNVISDEIGGLLDALDPGALTALFAGHSHSRIATTYRGTPVIESHAEGRAIGRIDLEHDPASGETRVVSVGPVYDLCRAKTGSGPCSEGTLGAELAGEVQPDERFTEVLAECRSLPCAPLGEVAVDFTRERMRESPLGSLIADLLREATPGADFAVTNSGGLRGDLFAGPLDECGLFRVVPFDNVIVVVEMTAAEIELMLRIGSAGAHGILQVSGLRYDFEPCVAWKPEDDLDGNGERDLFELDRLRAVRTEAGAELDPKKLYKLITNNFLVAGGDDFGHVFGHIPPERIHIDYDTTIRGAVTEGIKKRKGPIRPAAGGPRIRIGPGEVDPTKWVSEACGK